jgi:hypothetical protein
MLFKIEPAKLWRAGRRVDPLPPNLRKGDQAAVWVNDQEDLGELIAFTTVAAVSALAHGLALGATSSDRLNNANGSVAGDLCANIDATRRSEVRFLSGGTMGSADGSPRRGQRTRGWAARRRITWNEPS